MKGVTLTEVLIVVVILAILGGLAAPYYIKAVERSKQAEALTALGEMRASLLRFIYEEGRWPTNEDKDELDWGEVDNPKYFGFDFILGGSIALEPKARATRNDTEIGPFKKNYTIIMYLNGEIENSGP